MRCRRIFRRRFLNSTEYISDTMRTSFYHQQDEELAMSNAPMYTRRRYTPYGILSHHQRINLHKWDQMNVNMEEGAKPPERKMERDKQDDTSENWFKVTIPFGIKYDKKWMLNLIQSQCSIPFTPVQFHYEKMQATFFVDDPNIAFMLKAISDKIRDETDNKRSFFESESIKTLVLQFLQQYYFIYDNGDREGLLNAYHADACFSLTVPFSTMDLSASSVCEYVKYSRSMKVLKDPYMRKQLLKHKKCDIIHFLRALPKTQHDLTSFSVDICFQTEKTLCFSVSGLFKEVVGKNSFVCSSINLRECFSSSLCIINDKLSVRNVYGFPSASNAVDTCSSSRLPSLSQDQQQMMPTFCSQSGVNVERSQKCLHDDQWNYNKAIQSFALLKVTFANSSQVRKGQVARKWC
ncbi:similar to nuclear RNA export factor 2 (predicted), isoform CRA_a [Rattus norvegicus]|nr:similar to nuclear RNA export factor 2 (predicted), isoform CRA_a [Rattus norvegicus]